MERCPICGKPNTKVFCSPECEEEYMWQLEKVSREAAAQITIPVQAVSGYPEDED